MAKQVAPPEQPLHPAELQEEVRPLESSELAPSSLTSRVSASTTVLEEILARGDDRRYATHWGINE
jgi:hypothetical protein